MREIKFRGRDTDGNWHYGDLLRYVRDSYDMIIPVGHANSDDLYDDVVCVDYDTVGQFTGLKDKNGEEVYEGDILANSHDVRVIEWRDYQWSMVSHTHPFQKTVPMIWVGGYRVIGNVHDNPELLEAKDARD